MIESTGDKTLPLSATRNIHKLLCEYSHDNKYQMLSLLVVSFIKISWTAFHQLSILIF